MLKKVKTVNHEKDKERLEKILEFVENNNIIHYLTINKNEK